MFSVETLILVGGVLLLLGIASSKLSSRLGVPGLVLFLLLGMLAGSEGPGGIEFENYPLAYGIGTLALALILFDGGLSTPISTVKAVWKPALSLATVGVLITAVITGLAASWVLGLTLLQGLLLGGIVSSTDAAAVFSILRNGGVGLPKRIGSILEVESGSNDPMAIFLTIGCIELLTERMTFGPALFGLFLAQMVLGGLFGVGMGYLATWVVNRIELGAPGLYPVLVTTFCLLTFGLAAQFGGSGFLAVYIAGLVLGNQRIVFRGGIRVYHDAIAWLSQIMMFVMLGLLSFPSRLWDVAPQALLVALVLVLVARPISVWLSMLPFRARWKELTFISWVGLKGAVPITLATFPLMQDVPSAKLIFDVVFFIVVVSALVQGSTMAAVAGWLGLRQPTEPAPPVTLEISSLRQVDGEIVDFTIRPNSRAVGRLVKDLALPEGVVIALIARGDQVIPPQGRTEILAGDHVIVVLRPGTRPLVNQVFGGDDDSRGEIPAALEFPLRGSVTCAELHELYGILIEAPPEETLSQVMRRKLGGGTLKTGTAISFGPLLLRIRSLDTEGNIELVGMAFLAESEITQAERQQALKPGGAVKEDMPSVDLPSETKDDPSS
ncbi:MAG: potassium/proton antiporter [Pirellulaceae bacterium]